MVGVARIFIKNFSLHAHPLIKLTQKDEPFIFGPEQIKAQEDLKTALLESPALRAIYYTSSAPIILAVDTSYIAVGFYLCQCNVTTLSRRYHSRFCSIKLNDRESKYSQPKLEIYGDTPLAPSPRVDRSRPKRSDVYRSSTQNADATTLRTPKVNNILLSILTIATPRDRGLSHPE
jgi:hypothetical protein